VSNRACIAEISDSYLRRSFGPSNGLVRNSSTPNLIALPVIGMSPYPLVKMIEI
jgi:hypothetical protein